MEYVRFFAELGAALMAAIACPFLVVVLMRSYRIPQCYSCGAMKVRPSRVTGFLGNLASAFLVRPFRCSGCRERFYAFLLFPSQVQRRQRVVKVAFRFRNGFLTRVVIRVVELPPATPASPAILQTYASHAGH